MHRPEETCETALTLSFHIVLPPSALDDGDVAAEGSSDLAEAGVLLAAKSRHISVAGVNHFHDLHWMIVKARRPIIYNLCVTVFISECSGVRYKVLSSKKATRAPFQLSG